MHMGRAVIGGGDKALRCFSKRRAGLCASRVWMTIYLKDLGSQGVPGEGKNNESI
jgi:hypothetical protein